MVTGFNWLVLHGVGGMENLNIGFLACWTIGLLLHQSLTKEIRLSVFASALLQDYQVATRARCTEKAVKIPPMILRPLKTPRHQVDPVAPSHCPHESRAYLRMGIPSFAGGGLILSFILTPAFSFSSSSSTLVSRFKKLLSLTGLPL